MDAIINNILTPQYYSAVKAILGPTLYSWIEEYKLNPNVLLENNELTIEQTHTADTVLNENPSFFYLKSLTKLQLRGLLPGGGNAFTDSWDLRFLNEKNKVKYIEIGSAAGATQLGLFADLSALTNLEYLYMGGVISKGNNPKAFPVIANNKNLTYVQINSNQVQGPYTAETIGDISQNLKLQTLNLSFSLIPTARIDTILQQMRTAKQNGGAIININLSGSSNGIPTGGSSNSDRLTLVSLGVTVTVRTV